MTAEDVDLDDLIEHFQVRVIRQACLDGTADWHRRDADRWAFVLPRQGDHLGRETTVEEREERRRRVMDRIAAHEMKAAILDGSTWRRWVA